MLASGLYLPGTKPVMNWILLYAQNAWRRYQKNQLIALDVTPYHSQTLAKLLKPTMKYLDPKSLVVGFLTAVLVTVTMGNALADKPVGKYQIAYHGKEEKMYIVDTTNGTLRRGAR